MIYDPVNSNSLYPFWNLDWVITPNVIMNLSQRYFIPGQSDIQKGVFDPGCSARNAAVRKRRCACRTSSRSTSGLRSQRGEAIRRVASPFFRARSVCAARERRAHRALLN
jgi:hypothetical protein